MSVLVASPGRTVTRASDLIGWDPLAEPVEETDTLLLARMGTFDELYASGARLYGTGVGSEKAAQSTLAANGFEFDPAGGPFGNGAVRPVNDPGGKYIAWGVDGLVETDEVTIGVWLMHPTLAWSAVASTYLAQITDGNNFVRLNLNAATQLVAAVMSNQPSGTPGKVTSTGANIALPAGTTAGTWHHLALIYRAGAWRALIDGVQTDSRVIATPLLRSGDPDVGIQLGGSAAVAAGMWMSDLHVRRTGLNPAAPVARRSLRGDLHVDTAAAGTAVPPRWLGGLHTAHPNTDPAIIAAALPTRIRTDKALCATPIKAGAPDATHPTLGQSGLYSYDWQVVDRTLDRIAAYGAKPYWSIDACPQILGGSVAPMTGTNLLTAFTRQSGFSTSVPNDITAWGHIVRDFVHHVVTTRGETDVWWSFWNEPEGGSWGGTMSQYMDFYVATAEAVRDMDPTGLMGGPELAGASAAVMSWVSALMDKCIATGAPLDFIAMHEYSGDLDGFATACVHVDKLAADRGLTTPFPVVAGEINWSLAHPFNTPLNYQIWTDQPWHIKAFIASYLAAWFARNLAVPNVIGVAVSHIDTAGTIAYGNGNPRTAGGAAVQLVGPTGERWASYNVVEGAQKVIGDTRLPLVADLPPGVYAYAGRDSVTGRIGVMIASYGWCNRATRKINLHLAGMTGELQLRRYLVDEDHSSAWDNENDPNSDPLAAGLPEEIPLEMVEDRTDTGARLRDLTLDVPPWSAQFLTLDPA